MARRPPGNIYWRDIPRDAVVEDAKIAFVVRLPDGQRKTAYWMGTEAIEAQTRLVARMKADEKAATARRSRHRRGRR